MAENTSMARLARTLAAGDSLDDLMRVKTSEHAFLLLDCSSSMDELMRNGKRRIDGLREAVKEIQSRRKTQMVAFGPTHEDRTVFYCGRVPEPKGGTPMADAILFAKEQKAGRVVIISDGWPDSPGATKDAAAMFGGQIDVVYVGDPGEGDGEAFDARGFLRELAESTGGTEFDGDLSDPKRLGGAVIGLLNGAVEEPEAE
jgi:hypothetical protein